MEVLSNLFDILYKKFGGTINEKNFKVLDRHVRVIQGDGVNRKSIKQIVDLLEKKGFSADNIIFGSGGKLYIIIVCLLMKMLIIIGGLLQKFDRDTMKFAIKCSYVEIDGIGGRPVAKDPITDRGKRNKSGRLKLVREHDDSYRTLSNLQDSEYEKAEDQLVTVFENGKLLREYSLDDIRANCDISVDNLKSMNIM